MTNEAKILEELCCLLEDYTGNRDLFCEICEIVYDNTEYPCNSLTEKCQRYSVFGGMDEEWVKNRFPFLSEGYNE